MAQLNSSYYPSEHRAMLLGLMAVGCWSTVATAFKIALSYTSVEQMLSWATLTSSLVLAAVLFIQGKLREAFRLLPGNTIRSLGMGLLNPLCYYFILFAAYDRLPAQVAQPVNYTWAIVLAWLAVPVLGHQLTRKDVIAMCLGYSGVVVISLGGGLENQPLSVSGLGLAILSTFVWAGYWLCSARDKRDPVIGLFQNFLVALPFTVFLAWPLQFDIPAVLSSIYIGIFEMGITFVLWLYALKLTRHTSRISNLIFISPFVSLVLIHFVLGESVRMETIAGLMLIVIALRWQNTQSS